MKLRCYVSANTATGATLFLALIASTAASDIDNKYAELGHGKLGSPKGPEYTVGDKVGRARHYDKGSIFWTPTTGAHVIYLEIRDHWNYHGGTEKLGYPTSDESNIDPAKTAGYIHRGSFQHGEVYCIYEPDVKRAKTDYKMLRYREGDILYFYATGCCQTGGWGSTWKRYVDPEGPNSGKLYHGLLKLPIGPDQGQFPSSPTVKDMVRFSDALNKPIRVAKKTDYAGPMWVILGYEDDGYGDNGYDGHDNGTGNQCKDQGNATVFVTILHPSK
jgi:hypothetical protein